ncbi:FAD-dependent oxidoreductase [Actinophytocola sp.]|uniref:FAD-dependent oxidoreductase n=1 Tax=Actinophytocola sp. TaxID=1872138 RepID=UPI002EDA095F
MAELPEFRSLWIDTTPAPDRSSGSLPTEADVVVIGAGIAGLTTAYLLAEAGRPVLVLEASTVGGGVSGHTTAKLTAQHGLIYRRLSEQKSLADAAAYGAHQLAALNWVAATARSLGIDCELERSAGYVYTTDPARRDTLRAEADAARAAGLPASYTDSVDLPLPVAGAVRFADQARFHPRRWLLGLAERFEALGGRIIEGVRATGVRSGRPAVVRTTAGVLRANQVVVATHYPFLDRGLFFARLDPVRDLVVAGPLPTGLALSGMYLDADTHHSVRLASASGEPMLVVGGEHYRVGDSVDVRARYVRLAEWAREHLGLTDLRYRWSAHDMSTVDGVPYVGRYHPGSRNLWVATGFGQWGMTGGTAAGLLLRDLVLERPNELADLYDPNRLSLHAVPSLASDNLTVAKHLAGDHLRALVSTDLAELSPDEGVVTRAGATMVAAYRSTAGELMCVSARCTHLGCLVAFNNAERSWDCPCHGSRFAVDGSVLQGPAVRPLRRLSAEESAGTSVG